MINKLKINNFRGIKSLSADNLGQVNLLIGDNNCGKSSFLEALFILSNPQVPPLDIRINTSRGLSSDPRYIDTLFYNVDTDNPISILFTRNNKNYQLDIEYFSEKSVFVDGNKEVRKYGLSHSLVVDGVNFESNKKTLTFVEEKINDETELKIDDFIQDERNEDLFIDTRFIRDGLKGYEYISEILKNKEEGSIISVLKRIDSRIVDIVFDASDRIALVDIGLKSRIPINVMGDGMRRLLNIIVAIYQQKNGMLLLDEVDNGIHYRNMPILWQAIIEAAVQFNVQIFATTHSVDSLKGLKEVLELGDNAAFESCHINTLYLRNDDGLVTVLNYDCESFEDVINAEIEIR